MLWGNNKKEVEDLQKQVDKAITDICQLQHNMELLKTNQNSLRGLINRKIGVPETKGSEIPEISETENNIKPSIFLSPNGLPI